MSVGTINQWFLEDADGESDGTYYDNYDTARDEARQQGKRLIEVEYEWSDSYMIEDYTGEDDDD